MEPRRKQLLFRIQRMSGELETEQAENQNKTFTLGLLFSRVLVQVEVCGVLYVISSAHKLYLH